MHTYALCKYHGERLLLCITIFFYSFLVLWMLVSVVTSLIAAVPIFTLENADQNAESKKVEYKQSTSWYLISTYE